MIVHHDTDGEWVGISRQPATVGERFMLMALKFDGLEGELPRRMPVCVIESRPLRTRARQPGTIRHAVARHLTVLDRPAIDRVM